MAITIATVNWTIHLFDYVQTAGTTLDLNLFLTFASYIYIVLLCVQAFILIISSQAHPGRNNIAKILNYAKCGGKETDKPFNLTLTQDLAQD